MSSTLESMATPYISNPVTASKINLVMAATLSMVTTITPSHVPQSGLIAITESTLNSQIRNYAKVDLIVFEYKILDDDLSLINDWLQKSPDLKSLISGLPSILRKVYGEGVKKELAMLSDPDTGDALIDVSLYTGLPLDQEFDDKEKLLFDLIENAGLSAGLQHVVISQR